MIREVAALTPGLVFSRRRRRSESHLDRRLQELLRQGAAVRLGPPASSLIGWDALGQLDSQATGSVVQYWTSADNARAAVAHQAKVLMSPASKAYMDMKYNAQTPLRAKLGRLHRRADRLRIGIPPRSSTASARAISSGLEAPLWTETLKTLADLEYMAFPRLAGYAEIGWSKADGRTWDEYKARLATHGPRLKCLERELLPIRTGRSPGRSAAPIVACWERARHARPSADTCLEAYGCSVRQSCQVACPSLTTMSACSAVPICNWEGTYCTYGANNPCPQLSQRSCASQVGCVWTTGCVGQAKSCVGLAPTECRAIPHCYVETVPDFEGVLVRAVASATRLRRVVKNWRTRGPTGDPQTRTDHTTFSWCSRSFGC